MQRRTQTWWLIWPLASLGAHQRNWQSLAFATRISLAERRSLRKHLLDPTVVALADMMNV
jgi:hypothetical protein